MAEFKIDGRMTVRKLKENFKHEFEGILRVYDGRELADDKATLAAIRKGDAKGGEFVCRASRTVGKFEQEMKEVFGIRVQVASPDDYILALDGITLANLKNIKEKATKADMEELVAYKRNSNCECDKKEEDSSNERLTIKQYIKTLEYVFERFDMVDMDGSYFTEWGTLDELFDDNQIDEALENASWQNENNEWVDLEGTGYEYRDEVSDEIMEELVSELTNCLDQGEIKSLIIRDGDKILHEESNDEPYYD
jgi:hypothetical protein